MGQRLSTLGWCKWLKKDERVAALKEKGLNKVADLAYFRGWHSRWWDSINPTSICIWLTYHTLENVRKVARSHAHVYAPYCHPAVSCPHFGYPSERVEKPMRFDMYTQIENLL